MKNTTEPIIPDNRPASITADVAVNRSKTLFSTEASEPASMSSSPQLSAPLFTKKSKAQVESKAGIGKTAEADEIASIKHAGEDKSEKEGKKIGQVQAGNINDPPMKSSDKQQQVKKFESSTTQSSRPSNPFLKSSVK